MKKIFQLFFLFVLVCFNGVGQSVSETFGDLFSNSDTGDLTKIIEFRNERQLDSLFKRLRSPLLVIGTYIYKPYQGCIIKRQFGGFQEERLAGGTASDARKIKGANEGRNSDGEDAQRNGSGDIAKRADGAGANDKRTGTGDIAGGRSSDGGNAQREGDRFKLFRENDGGNIKRDSTQGGNARRNGSGDALNRNNGAGDTASRLNSEGGNANRSGDGGIKERGQVSGGTVKIQCKKLNDVVGFELLNISEKAKIKVYDVLGLRENIGTKVEYY